MHPRARAIIAAVSLSLVTAACGGTDSGGALEPPVDTAPPTAGDVAQVNVSLSEWTVAAAPAATGSSVVNFRVSNDGTQDHEFVVIRTDLAPDQLPTTDGAVVDTEAEGLTVRSERDPFPAGETTTLTLTLDPGAYVLICNIAGHYQQGMRSSFDVG